MEHVIKAPEWTVQILWRSGVIKKKRNKRKKIKIKIKTRRSGNDKTGRHARGCLIDVHCTRIIIDRLKRPVLFLLLVDRTWSAGRGVPPREQQRQLTHRIMMIVYRERHTFHAHNPSRRLYYERVSNINDGNNNRKKS